MLVEPVSGAERYPLRTAADALAVIDRVQAAYDVPNLGLLADLYHLAINGDDVDRVIAEHTDRVAHVQIADAPGPQRARHRRRFRSTSSSNALAASGYDGWVGLEYKPPPPPTRASAGCPTSTADRPRRPSA